jgi:hypothetical protein
MGRRGMRAIAREDRLAWSWRHGFLAPERIKHHVNEDGSHRIEVVLQGDEVEYEAPKRITGPLSLGHSTGSAMKKEGDD